MAFQNSLLTGEVVNNLNAVDKLPVSVRAIGDWASRKDVAQPIETQLQTTKSTPPQSVNGETVYAKYTISQPWPEQALLAYEIFETLRKEIESYQLDKRNCWFEEHRDMLVLNDDEKANPPDRQEIREAYLMYAERWATRATGYIFAKMSQLAAVLNLGSTARLTNGVFAKIMSDLRPSYLNPNFTHIGLSPEPVIFGSAYLDKMLPYMRFLVGQTTFNARVLAFPLIDHSIWGNRYQHSVFPSDLSYKDKDGNVITLNDANAPNEIKNLIHHMAEAVAQHGIRQESNHPKRAFRDVVSNPVVENIGGLFTYDAAHEVSVHCKDNFDGAQIALDSYTPDDSRLVASDNLTSRLWNNFFTSDKYLNSNFSEYFNPNDYGVRWLIEKGYLRVCMDWQAISKKLSTLKNGSILETLKLMEYKRDCQVNTATIVKYAPLRCKSGDDLTEDRSAEGVRYNYERFDLKSCDPATVIKKMKEWPGVAPRIFGFPAAGASVVVNSVSDYMSKQPNYSVVSGNPQPDNEIHQLIYGQTSTLWDYLIAIKHDTQNRKATFVGLTKESAQSFIDAGETQRPIIFDENPDSLFVAESPIIDTTDITKCGFDIMISYNSVTMSEWEKYFQNPDYWTDASSWNQDGTPPWGDVSGAGKMVCDITVPTNEPDTPGIRAHTCNQDYVALQKHCFIHVGAGILQHPAVILGSQKACNFFHDLKLSNANASLQGFGKDIADFSTTTGISDYIKDLRELCLEPADPSEAIDQADDMSSFLVWGGIEDAADNHEKHFLFLFAFDPTYGPVLMNVPNISTADQDPYILPSLNEGRDQRFDQSTSMIVQIGRRDLGGLEGGSGTVAHGRTPLSMEDQSAWDYKIPDHTYAGMKFIIPFISGFECPVIKYEPKFRQLTIAMDGGQRELLNGDTLWFLHIMSRIDFSFGNANMHRSLKAIVDGKKFSDDIKQVTITGLDSFTVVEEQRDIRNERSSKPDNSSVENRASSEGSSLTNNVTNNASGGNNNNGKKNRRNHSRNRSRGRQDKKSTESQQRDYGNSNGWSKETEAPKASQADQETSQRESEISGKRPPYDNSANPNKGKMRTNSEDTSES